MNRHFLFGLLAFAAASCKKYKESVHPPTRVSVFRVSGMDVCCDQSDSISIACSQKGTDEYDDFLFANPDGSRDCATAGFMP